jgi:hypothetical protein
MSGFAAICVIASSALGVLSVVGALQLANASVVQLIAKKKNFENFKK